MQEKKAHLVRTRYMSCQRDYYISRPRDTTLFLHVPPVAGSAEKRCDGARCNCELTNSCILCNFYLVIFYVFWIGFLPRCVGNSRTSAICTTDNLTSFRYCDYLSVRRLFTYVTCDIRILQDHRVLLCCIL